MTGRIARTARRGGELYRRDRKLVLAFAVMIAVTAAICVALRPLTGQTWWIPFSSVLAGMLLGTAFILMMAGRG